MMINYDDMITVKQSVHLRTYIANRIKISEHVLRNMSISEIQEAHFNKVYEVIQAFYRGDPVIEDKGETVEDTEEVPINWWHMLLDRIVPRNRLGFALSIRHRIQYRTITTRTEHTKIIYNVCPHMNTDSEVHHSQWLDSDPKQSMDMASLLHILRNNSDGRELDTLRKIWYSQKLGENYGTFDVVLQTIADLIEATLRKGDNNET